ncbi:MAG: hypothetical protein SV910_08005 [Chloroflexota bacterium]|nr:hypothetical protein [Chloroflexota bacterium]
MEVMVGMLQGLAVFVGIPVAIGFALVGTAELVGHLRTARRATGGRIETTKVGVAVGK